MKRFLPPGHWFRHTKLGLVILLATLFVSDLSLHLITPPVHAAVERVDDDITLSHADGVPVPRDDAPCEAPGHCCGASHHHHFAFVVSATSLIVSALVIALAEWDQSAVPSYASPAARIIRSPPSICSQS
jgi:hypothetical protein